MGGWVEQVERRAAILQDQMASARVLAERFGEDPFALTEPYRAMLRELYEDELPFARTIENSDLVLRMQGPAVDVAAPRLTLVSDAFTNIRTQVREVAKAIAGLTNLRGKLPDDVELGLSGLARGSLIVGVRLPEADEHNSGENLTVLDESDQLHQAVREAIRKLAVVTQYVSEDGVDEELARIVPDPGLRDTLTVAAKRLAPTGRQGITSVSLHSPEFVGIQHPLTPQVRKAISRELRRPVRSSEYGSYEGIVREIDLDAKRFEIRNVRGPGAVRCIYPESLARSARKWLDKRVHVTGLIERAENGVPRLMLADNVEVSEVTEHDQPDIFR